MRHGNLGWGLGLVLGLAGAWSLAGIIGTAPAGSRAAPPAPPAFTFAAPINASNSGGSGAKPGALAAAADGSVVNAYPINNIDLTLAANASFYSAFSTLSLDSAPDLLGSERLKHDSVGRLHLAWYHNNSDGTTDIYYAVRDPGTANGTWQRVGPIPGTTTGPNTGGNYKVVSLAVGANDRVWLAFSRDQVGCKLMYTDDAGVSWSQPEDVPGPFSGTASNFEVGASLAGYAMVSWFERETPDLFVNTRFPDGHWGVKTDISAHPNKGQSYTGRWAGDPAGGLSVAWPEYNSAVTARNLWYRHWTPTAGWDPNLVQLTNLSGSVNSNDLVADASGQVHIVFDTDFNRPAQNTATYYMRGQGTTFTPPEQVFPQFGNATSRYPDLDVNSVNGGATVAHIVANSNITTGSDNWYTWTDAGLPPTPTPAPTLTSTPAASPTPCTANTYSDVPPANPFYGVVQDLSVRGAISGYGDCTFRPYANITRGQIAKVIMLADAYTLVNPATPDFADVPYGTAFYLFIETAYTNGIISGYACGGPNEPCDAGNRPYFRPYNNVTRGQLSKMVVLAKHWTLLSPAQGDFADVSAASPFYSVVETAYAHGIISGYGCGGPGEPCDAQNHPYFRVFGTATRGQGAKIIDLAITATRAAPNPGP